MTIRFRSTALAAFLALSLPAGAAVAQTYAPPARVPTAAAVGASASPLIGQGYLPPSGSRNDGSAAGAFHTERSLDGRHPLR